MPLLTTLCKQQQLVFFVVYLFILFPLTITITRQLIVWQIFVTEIFKSILITLFKFTAALHKTDWSSIDRSRSRDKVEYGIFLKQMKLRLSTVWQYSKTIQRVYPDNSRPIWMFTKQPCGKFWFYFEKKSHRKQCTTVMILICSCCLLFSIVVYDIYNTSDDEQFKKLIVDMRNGCENKRREKTNTNNNLP